MSLTCKDIDLMIMNKLDDDTLSVFGTTNRHYSKIYNSSLLWIQKIRKICDPYLGLNSVNTEKGKKLLFVSYRQWYYDLIRCQDDPVRWLFTALNEKQYHVIYCVLLTYNPNYSFVLNRNYIHDIKEEYVSKKSLADTVWRFIPTRTIIMAGDYISWTLLKQSPWNLRIFVGDCLTCINSGNVEIFQEVLEIFLSSEPQNQDNDPYSFRSMIVFAIRCDQKDILQILLSISGKEIWTETCKCLTSITNEFDPWKEENNDTAFTYFISFMNTEGVDVSFLYRKIRKIR